MATAGNPIEHSTRNRYSNNKKKIEERETERQYTALGTGMEIVRNYENERKKEREKFFAAAGPENHVFFFFGKRLEY